MATFKAEVYEHQKRSDGTWNIKIRVTHNQKKKYLATQFYIYKQDLTRAFKIKNQRYIDECDKIIRRYRSACEKLGERIKTMDVDQIVSYIQRPTDNVFDLDVVAYGRRIANDMRDAGSAGNANAYDIAINNLVKFVGRDNISIKEITSGFVSLWIKWIQEQPALKNKEKGTRAQSLYPSALRAIHNRAKKEFNDEDAGIIHIPLSPFSKITLPKVGITRKRALELDQIKSIVDIPYDTIIQPGNNRFNLAKDIYILSFALVGMNAVDLYNCTDFKNGRITYERQKTKNRRADRALISIKVQPEIKCLFDKYRDHSGERVFNFYKHYSTSGAFSIALNIGLKRIGAQLSIEDLEFYSARHSWATIAANEAGVDKYTVHSALNHVDDAMRVTDIYIKKSWEPIDEANRKVIEYVGLNIQTVEEPIILTKKENTIFCENYIQKIN